MLSHRSLPEMPAFEFAAGRLNGILHPWSIPPIVGHDAESTIRHCRFAVPVVNRPCRQRAIEPWAGCRSGGREGAPHVHALPRHFPWIRPGSQERFGPDAGCASPQETRPHLAPHLHGKPTCVSVLFPTGAEACRTPGQRCEAGRGHEGNPEFRALPIDLSGIGTN